MRAVAGQYVTPAAGGSNLSQARVWYVHACADMAAE
jgi:hypothetical protein